MLRVADYYSGSDTGRQRRGNEDSLFARAPLFVVADGMGGAQAGEVASRTAVEAFQHGLGDGSSPEQSLAARAREANARIHELSQSSPEHAGMGTTLTAVYVGPEEISIAHVGDSRAYCLRAGELVRLTDDHSLVDELLRQGKLTPEEAEDHPQRSIITRALGPEPAVEIDTRTHRARAGDVYLLCSDGLTTMVSEQRVTEILLANPRLRDAGEALLAAANAAGGRDNITVVLFRLEEVGAPLSPEHDQATVVGAAAPSHEQVQAALAEQQVLAGQQAAPVAKAPRLPSAAEAKPRRRRARALVAPLVVLVVIGLLLFGAYVASQSVYFIGTNDRGFVTMFRGVPFVLPGNLKLYTPNFVSGVSAATLSADRRRTLLDHSLRSHDDAADLVRRLERGQLSQ